VLPRFLDEWRAERRLRRNATLYAQALQAEPDEDDVSWLAALGTGGDLDRARWELRYARRALGLMSAQRDALDDQTASAVAREISSALSHDRHVGAGMTRVAERQFNARLRAYVEAASLRGSEALVERLGRALLVAAGATSAAAPASLARASEIVGRYMAQGNDALRDVFGVASLPEHIAPSAAHEAAKR
jgi:hypothetical protein